MDIKSAYQAAIQHNSLIQSIGLMSDTCTGYICPICKNLFRIEQINELSLEDAPQQAIGGHKIAITCKSCNNSCGHNSDKDFIHYIKRLDERAYIQGSDRSIKVQFGNDFINGELIVGDNRELTLKLLDKINNPNKLSEFISNTVEGSIIDIQDKSKSGAAA